MRWGPFPFTAGGDATGIIIAQFIHGDASPKGWEIDAAAEWAIAPFTLPPDCQQVCWVRIKAVGLAAPGAGNGMLLDIQIDAGGDDEGFQAEAIAVANKVNSTLNFAANDVIQWLLTPADDSDIGDLIADDHGHVKVRFETFANGDIDTDAVFGTVTFEGV